MSWADTFGGLGSGESTFGSLLEGGLSQVPIIGSYYDQLNARRAQNAQEQALMEASKRYQEMKPIIEQGYMNALQQRMNYARPINTMLANMGGQPFDYSMLFQNPLPQPNK